MRTLLMLASALAMTAAAGAQAQQRGGAPRPGGWSHGGANGGGWHNGGQMVRPGGGYAYSGPRWGGRIGGRWWGGMRAPGGWGAYRRPVRGWVLPSYWAQPGWYVSDWSGYGLAQPPYGYNWSRYYDDAVLIDGRGTVYDRVGGVAWDRYDAAGTDYAYRGDGYGYPAGGAPQIAYRDADRGVGGAIVGGVVGGVAGNLIAGRGNRLAGTLVGAGAGALIGNAIDRSDRAGREYRAAPSYGAPYPAPGYDSPAPAYGAPTYGATYAAPQPGAPMVAYQTGSYGGDYAGTTYSGTTYYGPAPVAAPEPEPRYPAAYPYPPAPYAAPNRVVAGNGAVVTTTSTQAGGGYVAGGWYFPGTTVTTVTVAGGGSAGYEEVYETVPTYTKGSVRRYVKGGCHC